MTILPASGPPGPLMIIGDYPTNSEWESKKCFGGGTGSLFNRLLKPFGKKIGDIYSTYLVKAPISGFSSRSKKTRDEAWNKAWGQANWIEMLQSEIDACNPNAIILFGEKTLNYLCNEKTINKQRGSILHVAPELVNNKPIKVVPILSPRDIYIDNERPIQTTQWDINKAIRVSQYRGEFRTPGLVWIVKSAQELNNYWQRASTGDFLTFDIETHHGYITCISFCTNGQEAISVPFLIGRMDALERASLYKQCFSILNDKIPKVNQNIKYDWTVLERYGFQVKNIVGDTMLMAHTIYPELPKGLDFLASIYTDQPYYKDEGKDFDPKRHDWDRLLLYNAKDALVTWNVWKEQQEDAKAYNVFDFFHKRVWPTFFIYKKMDQRGIRVDDERRRSLLGKYIPLLEENNLPLKLIAGRRDFNPESPTQVGKLLYEELGIKPKYHTTPTGNMAYSTDEKTLDGLILKGGLSDGQKEIILKIKFARKVGNVIGFLENPISRDGKMRMSSKLHGTETGRTSMSKALEERYRINEKGRIEQTDSGWSFQTLGKHGFDFGGKKYGADLRSIFISSPGYSFVSGDQSQAEARVVAVLSNDIETLQLFDRTDIHTLTATWVLGKEFSQISKDERQFCGKVTRHAGNYNESPGGLMIRSHKTFRECSFVLDKFHAASPKIRGIFHADIRRCIDKDRRLISPHGRRRDFLGIVDEDMYKEAFATIPQATVSDHSKQTILTGLMQIFSEPEVYPINEAHDGLDFEVKCGMEMEFIAEFDKLMKTPILFNECSLPRDIELVIPGEYEMGTIWCAPDYGGDLRRVKL
jgi:uracil-DNA glycosylase family 4